VAVIEQVTRLDVGQQNLESRGRFDVLPVLRAKDRRAAFESGVPSGCGLLWDVSQGKLSAIFGGAPTKYRLPRAILNASAGAAVSLICARSSSGRRNEPSAGFQKRPAQHEWRPVGVWADAASARDRCNDSGRDVRVSALCLDRVGDCPEVAAAG
jgi:hypothetical protein